MWDFSLIVKHILLMATFLHWGTVAATELYQFCKYIANENEKMRQTR